MQSPIPVGPNPSVPSPLQNPIYTPNFLDVRRFGAVGDGIADDTVAFARWAERLNTFGGVGYIPTGRFRVKPSTGTPAISITNPAVRLLGDGLKASIIDGSVGGSSGIVLNVNTAGVGGFSAEGFQVIGSTKAIVCTLVYEAVFDRVYVASSTQNGWEMDTCVDVTWRNCHTTGGVAGHGVTTTGAGECNGWRFFGGRYTGNHFANKYGINFDGGTSLLCDGTIIEGYEQGIRLGIIGTAQAVVVHGCYFEAFDIYGVYAGNGIVNGLTVQGCYFNGGGGTGASQTAIASKAQSANIGGNRFVNNTVDIQTIAGAGRHEIGTNTTDNTGANYITDTANVCAMLSRGAVSRTGAYTVTLFDSMVRADATAGPFTVTLPPGPASGFTVTIKKIDASANSVTVGGTVDGIVNPILPAQYNGITVLWNGTSWSKLSSV